MAKFHTDIFPKQPNPDKVAVDPMKNAVKKVAADDAVFGGTKIPNGPNTTSKGAVNLREFYKGPKK